MSFLGEMKGKAAAKLVKPYVGPILQVVVAEIIKMGGGDPESDACMLWEGRRVDGKQTVMAKVYRRSEEDEPQELLGVVDVLKAAQELDFSQFISE